MNWRDLAACVIPLPNTDLIEDDDEYERAYEAALTNTDFIREPDEVTAMRWAKLCSVCPVIRECYRWGNEEKVSGVFVAGEWRE